MLRVVEAVQRTDTGRQREANEDAYFSRAPLFAVADGMGGARAGEVASRMAVEAFEPERDDATPPERYLELTARRANRAIFEFSQRDDQHSGMGTTLTAALISGDDVSIGHVGDSRAYLLRDGELNQLTRDHSLVEEWRRQGRLTAEQAEEHPQRSIITRALGPEPDVEVDTFTLRGRDSDVFLLCSDGLTTMLTDDEVVAELERGGDLDAAARRLIRAANERGGRDNITVVLFRVAGAEAPAPAEGATLIGPTAETEGFSAEAVRAAAGEPGPSADAKAPRDRRRWLRRGVKALVALLVLAALVGGAIYGARQVWFLGTDDGGRIALYRGLPYELPFGVELYSERYASPVTLDALPEERRGTVVDHELRSEEDARSLLEDLEVSAAAAATPAPPAAGNDGGSGAGAGGGRRGSGGGGAGGGGSG